MYFYVKLQLSKDSSQNPGNEGDSGPMWNKFWNSTFAGSVAGETESDVHSSTSNGDNKSITSAGAYQQQAMYQQQQQQQYMQQQQQIQQQQQYYQQFQQQQMAYAPQQPYMQQQPYAPQQPMAPPLSPSPQPMMVGGINPGPSRTYSVLSGGGGGGARGGYDVANTVVGGNPGAMDDSASTTFSGSASVAADASRFAFKLKHPLTGKLFRFTSSISHLSELLNHVDAKLAGGGAGGFVVEPGRVGYEDDEGDLVHLMTDSDLQEAVEMARRLGWTKLTLVIGGSEIAVAAEGARGLAPATADSQQPVVNNVVAAATGVDSGANALVTRGGFEVRQNDQQHQVPPPTLLEFLKEAPLSVNVALSAGVVVIAAFVVSRLQRM
jgi:hypothetical protein